MSGDKVAESLHYDAAAQHVGKLCDTFTVSVAVLEGLREMLCHKQGKVGILCLLFRIFIAVAVNSHDAVGIFINHSPFGIHTESTD